MDDYYFDNDNFNICDECEVKEYCTIDDIENDDIMTNGLLETMTEDELIDTFGYIPKIYTDEEIEKTLKKNIVNFKKRKYYRKNNIN